MLKNKALIGSIALPMMMLTAVGTASAFQAQGKAKEERAERFPKPMMFMKHLDSTSRTVSTLENGVEIRSTIEDADMLENIQERIEHKQEKTQALEGVQHDLRLEGDTLIVTITSDDPEMVEKIHERERMHALRASVTRTVENLTNGVSIRVTSDNPEAVTMLQEKQPLQSERENSEVSVTRTNIENGIETTITTENQSLVEKIQERANREKMGPGRGKGHGKMRGKEMRGMGEKQVHAEQEETYDN